jgi:arylsulfatase
VTLDETLDIGFDTGTPVDEDYADKMPFEFTGKLAQINDNLAGSVDVKYSI